MKSPSTQHNSNQPSGRVIEIYPSLYCNFQCSHCHVSSSPYVAEEGIKADTYRSFLEYAFGNGFDTVRISGGEPFLYPEIGKLIHLIKEIGFKVHICTNASLLDQSEVKKLLKDIDTLEISVDGIPDLHNEIRNSADAFEKMIQGLIQAKSEVGNYGFSHTLTCKSWDSLLWLGEFAYDHGASFLNLNPLKMQGRAQNEMLSLELDQITLHKVYFLNQYLQNKYENKMKVDLRVMHKPVIEQTPSTLNVYPEIKKYAHTPLSQVIKKLVIDENGDILPMAHGFSPQFIISNIHFYQEKYDVFKDFMFENGKELKNFLMQTYWKIINEEDRDFFNIEEEVVAESWNMTVPQTA